ncbi:3-deoxy-D-manno-octulosonic acid transferase [Thioclava atlantica]|uniref:3-deoxy-D-manno-octulosonic acid transferase n=1 Tax=Thioclava atlantica TaxID=1317124 RepID=A0A085TVI4_9RHOB|nr:glycosyltransferase N-terminal domain-containing protein [Thioclava atlantica]KFE34731.1 3-deoxy-D-manno-octulosonic-acid transferase [Thioclava atlantica]
MTHSLPLWLRLRLAALRPAGPRARSAAQAPRERGPLLWIWAAEETGPAATLIARRVAAHLPDARICMTVPEGLDCPSTLPEGASCLAEPEDRPASVRLVLEAWKPELILIMGGRLPAALITEAHRRGIPLILADAHYTTNEVQRLDAATLSLLGRFDRIYLRHDEGLENLCERLSRPSIVVNDGALGEPPDPLAYSEAERSSMADSMGARPVWLAAAIPEAEIDKVTAAHRYAQRHAHRLLLLLAPDADCDGATLAERLTAEGWAVARRSLEGEPEMTTEIFIADDASEYGLWYRLAALSYMGGTLSGLSKAPRSPMEAAALGSAVLHGPKLAPFREEYLRLEAARACRGVRVAADLPDALTDMISPDRSAHLAHNAWLVISGGAGAVETVARDLAEILIGTQLSRSA